MAEEKPTQITPEPRMVADDLFALEYVLEHVRGTTPSSLSAPIFAEDNL